MIVNTIEGHVHAGQFYPTAPLTWMLLKYWHGLYETVNGSYVYVSAGVHFWAVPMKIWGLAEITVIDIW